MKNVMKKRCIALIMGLCMCISLLSPMTGVSADAGRSVVFTGNGYEVTYVVDSSWSGAFNAHIDIKNTSQGRIDDWYLEFNMNQAITNIWNAKVAENSNGRYLIDNYSWNQDIYAGGTVSFGFTVSGDSNVLPSDFKLISEKNTLPGTMYNDKFSVSSDWGSGFSGAITLTNVSAADIEDWIAEFDFEGSIDTLWNGQIISSENNHFIVENSGYNQRIAPGASVIIGFNGRRSRQDIAPRNLVLHSFGAFSAGNDTAAKNDKSRLAIDTSDMFESDGEYYLQNDFQDLTGILNTDGAVKLTYTVCNSKAVCVAEGGMTVAENWRVENIPLLLGYNEVTVKAEYKNRDVITDSIVIVNTDEAKMAGLNIDTEDSDNDGLNNYLEDFYGTDPLKPDTDGDGIPDLNEIVDIGTDPLKFDTNDDGISDGDDDADKDGLSNSEEIRLGTLIYSRHSDRDGINDYDEVMVYHTDPLSEDTDKDGASDAWEIENGYDPLTFDESFVFCEEYSVGGNTFEVRITSSGDNIGTFKAVPDYDNPLINASMPGYTGSAFDFTIDGNFEKAEVKVYFDESLLEDPTFVPALYYINEETQLLEEIPGTWDGVSNYIYVELPHFSSYILLNKTAFEKVWENAIKAKAIDDNGSATNLNVAFVSDLSGSMRGSKITTMKSSINSFIDVLEEKDQAALISFNSAAMIRSGLTNDYADLKKKVNAMSEGGLTSIYTGVEKGIEVLKGNNGYKLMLVFTDGYDEPSTNYDSYYKPLVEEAKKNNIVIETIGISTVDTILLTKMSNETGGSYYYASTASQIRDKVKKVQEETIDYITDSNNDGISDYYTDLLCKGLLLDGTGNPVYIYATYDEVMANDDFDGDGIKNGDEYKISVAYNNNARVKIVSDMTSNDTDNDGITDDKEKAYGSSISVPDIMRINYDFIGNDGIYLATYVSEDILENGWSNFKLYFGNFIFNHKIDAIADYQVALINFLTAYSKVSEKNNFVKSMIDIYEDINNQYVSAGYEILGIIQQKADDTVALDEYYRLLKEVEKDSKHIIRDMKALDAADKRSFDTVEKISEALAKKMKTNYSNNEQDLAKWTEKLLGDLSDMKDNGIMKESDIDDLVFKCNKITKVSTRIPEKVKGLVKGTGKVLEVIGYITSVCDTASELYKTDVAYATLRTKLSDIEMLENIIISIALQSENVELSLAAFNVRDALRDDDEATKLQIASDIQTGVGGAISIASTFLIGKYGGPWGFAISTGLAIGELISGTAAMDKAALRTIAFGDAGVSLSREIKAYYLKEDGDICYSIKDATLSYIAALAQVRVMGEDAAAAENDASGFGKKLVNRIAYGSQADFENGLKDTIKTVGEKAEKLGFTVETTFPGVYFK